LPIGRNERFHLTSEVERTDEKHGKESLAHTVGFELLGDELGSDVESALKTALAGGAIFHNAADPLSIFRESLAASIRNIQSHPRGKLFQNFLLKGPYEGEGGIPRELRSQRLSDAETASVIAFIYSHMVNCFKGALAELLATVPCLAVLKRLQWDVRLPNSALLYVGDAVRVSRAKGKGLAKGADLHILIENRRPEAASSVIVAGVVEVKSFMRSEQGLSAQLDKHLLRAKKGLRVNGVDYPPDSISLGCGKMRRPVRIVVFPDDWKLPRTFRFELTENGRSLHVDVGVPPQEEDRITRIGDDEWRVTLRWSKEALAAAAYGMTFWYMEKVGEIIYSRGVPKAWSQMTPGEAGRNAATMMLYYAIRRCRTSRQEQRAIALYNSYGFGYTLGMNFRDAKGKRQMLWPEDLDEIFAVGKTKHGCRVVG
jgi:hypothetical protein